MHEFSITFLSEKVKKSKKPVTFFPSARRSPPLPLPSAKGGECS